MINIIQTYKESLSGLSREVWIISILMLVNRSGLMVVPFLSLYLTDSLEFTLIQAGAAGMWFGIGSMLSSFLGGSLTDRYGYHNVMKFSLIMGGLAFWLLIFAKTFSLFCFMVFCTALLADTLRPAVMSSISIYSKEENRTRAISLLRMAINLGIAIGPALGGFMVEHFGYEWLFIFNGGTSILTFVIFSFIFKTMKRRSTINNKDRKAILKAQNVQSAYKDYNYLYLLFILLLLSIAFIQIIFTVPLFFNDVYLLSEQQVGIFFTINGLLIVLFEMPIVSYYEKRRLFKKPIVIGGVLMVLSFLSLLIPIEGTLWMWLIPFLLYTFFVSIGELFNLPFFNSLSLARSNEHNSGSYMGLYAFNFSLAFTLAPIIGTRIIHYYGFNVLWIFCASITALSIVLFQVSRHRFLINENYK